MSPGRGCAPGTGHEPAGAGDATIWHLALLRDWEDAVAAGRYEWSTLGVTLADEGFVHASTAAQVDGVARRYYAQVEEPLVLLELDVAAVQASGAPVRWERVPGAQDPFPHVFGPLPVAAVLAATPYVVGDPVPTTDDRPPR